MWQAHWGLVRVYRAGLTSCISDTMFSRLSAVLIVGLWATAARVNGEAAECASVLGENGGFRRPPREGLVLKRCEDVSGATTATTTLQPAICAATCQMQ